MEQFDVWHFFFLFAFSLSNDDGCFFSRAVYIFLASFDLGGNDVFDFPWSRSWFDDRTSTRSVPSEAIVLESQSREIPSTRVESILFECGLSLSLSLSLVIEIA